MDDFHERFERALILGFEGDFKASMSALADLIAAFPDNLDVRYELAMTEFMLGMFDEGCGNLKLILSIDPTHEKALRQSEVC